MPAFVGRTGAVSGAYLRGGDAAIGASVFASFLTEALCALRCFFACIGLAVAAGALSAAGAEAAASAFGAAAVWAKVSGAAAVSAMLLVDQLRSAGAPSLMLAISGYVLVRFSEAYGLWHERRWGEWLGALSAALYVPFELRHFLHRPTVASAVVIAINVAVVGYLGWRLRRQSTSKR